MMTVILLSAILVLQAILLILALAGRRNRGSEDALRRLEAVLRAEFEAVRREISASSRDLRQETQDALYRQGETQGARQNELGRLQKEQLDTFAQLVLTLRQNVSERMDGFSRQLLENAAAAREDAEKLRTLVDASLKRIQEDNGVRLEAMRKTVDEKLHQTLEQRLGESFKLVSERLELVHKGLGEMQSLAAGVGDLKKALTNVKTRGVLGEIQLGSLLEQVLAPEQYARNVKTKANSNAIVEYAVKLPGRDESPVWLPVDAKFPTEDYLLLMDAYDAGDTTAIDRCRKNLGQRLETFARDVSDKYLDPPNTTDFAIIFTPTEGLYAEILRIPDLTENLYRKHHVTVTGPTNLAAFLNSLQMGFRTLAIEKRSSEVWNVLGAVKTEFGKFGDALDKTRKRMQSAVDEIDQVDVRTRQIQRKLREVESLPEENVTELIDGV
jgi:DNA recombination protein RmuC